MRSSCIGTGPKCNASFFTGRSCSYMAAQRGDHLVKMEAEMWMVYLQSHVRDRWHLGMRHEK